MENCNNRFFFTDSGKDFHSLWDRSGSAEQVVIVRKVRDVINQLKESRKTLVLLSPVLQFPPELEKDITVLDYSLPSLDELAQSLERVVRSAREISGMKLSMANGERELILNAARGLTCTEAENVFAKSLVMTHQLDVDVIISEKEQLIRRSRALEYFQSVQDFKDIFGPALFLYSPIGDEEIMKFLGFDVVATLASSQNDFPDAEAHKLVEFLEPKLILSDVRHLIIGGQLHAILWQRYGADDDYKKSE